MLMALLVAPGTWSILTSRNTHPDAALPNSGPAQSNITSSENRPAALGSQPQQITSEDRLNQKLLNFLLVNTEPDTYLMATGRASGAAPYILATGRSVLTFGGFLGQYDVVSVEQLAALVEQGQLRFVLGQDFNQHAALAMWIQTNCAQIDTGTMLSEQTIELYDCRKE